MHQYQSITSLMEPHRICVQNKQVMSWDLLIMDTMGPKFYMDSRGGLGMTVLPCKLGSPMSPAPFLSLLVDLTLKDRREIQKTEKESLRIHLN